MNNLNSDIINHQAIHEDFKFNGEHFTINQLLILAKDFISNGRSHEVSMGKFIINWFDDNSFIYVQTSGTTGAPKTIQLEKKAMIYSARATGLHFGLQPTNKILHCLPTNFIAGKMQLVRAFILGLDLDYVEPTSNPLAKNNSKYDFAAMVPLQVENAILGLKNIKKLIIGGAKINSNLENKLLKLKNIDVFETYGSTETVTHIAVKKVGEESFKTLPSVTITTDSRNCLIINAPKISNQEIITNDIIELINENEFLLLGRIDNVVNSGGIKLFPEQIEAKLASKLQQSFFIIGQDDDTLGQKVVLVIEGEKQEIDSTIFNNLTKFEIPKNIIFVNQFKQTETGKILRKQTIE